MSDHPTRHELLLFLRGGLPADRVRAVVAHLRECSRCGAAALPEPELARSANDLARELDPSTGEHPSLEDVLTPYAEGSLSGAARREVEEHLEGCATCREDVDDLRATAAVLAPRRSRFRPIAVAFAAAAVVVIGVTVVLRRQTDQPFPTAPPVVSTSPQPTIEPPPLGYARAEWDSLVENARGGTLPPMPAILKSLRRGPDVLRGSLAAEAQLAPVAVALETARPEFRWPARKGATATVIVFRGDEEVARSEPLTGSRWTPPRDLARGVTYTWHVNLESRDGVEILPSAPMPVARFHVIAAEALTEIETAERNHPDDHLLLALLHARAGLDAEARAHLRRVTDARDTATAQRFLRELDSWRDPDSEGRP